MTNPPIYLQTPDWGAIRPVYKKLSSEFHVLTSAYQIQLDQDTQLMLDHLIVAIDEIDQFIDDLRSKEERDSITLAIFKSPKRRR